MRFTRTSEYAVFLLIHLIQAGGGGPVTLHRISEVYDIPENILPQISSILNSKGWIEGRRGAGGGLLLSCDPEEITLREVVEAVSGPLAVSACLLPDGTCKHTDRCPLRSLMHEAQERMLSVLEETTIAELARTQG